MVEAADIEVLINEVAEVEGSATATGVVLKDRTRLPVDGVFIELGAKSPLELVTGLGVMLDDKGFVVTDGEQKTSVPGIYAAGDVCGPPFQVAKAVGEGCVAGLNAANYLKSMSGKK